MEGAGKDCTDLFNKYHRWVNMDSILGKCLVGTLVEEESTIPEEQVLILPHRIYRRDHILIIFSFQEDEADGTEKSMPNSSAGNSSDVQDTISTGAEAGFVRK